MIVLSCRGRRGFQHRRVTVYAYDGPLPPPAEHMPGVVLELRCPRCGYAPRVSNGELSALVMYASEHDGKLDLGQRVTLRESPPLEG